MKDFIDYLNQNISESIEENDKLFSELMSIFPGSNVFKIGGAVRDELISKYHLDMREIKNKDIDYLVTNVPMDKLQEFLSKRGHVEKVGASFGVLKFWFPEQDKMEEPIDIAIPRLEKEKEGEKGHKATDVYSSHDIPAEEDLKRRDFTINMIAKDIKGNTLDPFGGEADIKNKVLRMVKSSEDPNDPYHHFFIDPLRMLRGMQFIARFGLTPDKEIKKWFKIKASELQHITGERKQEELKKLFEKGIKVSDALKFAKQTGLIPYIFNGVDDIDPVMVNNLDNLSKKERSIELSIAALLKNVDSNTFNNVISRNGLVFSDEQARKAQFYHWFIRTNPGSEDFRNWMSAQRPQIGSPVPLEIASGVLKKIGINTDSIDVNLPYQYLLTKDYAIKGEELFALGLRGKEIGFAQNKIKDFLIKNPNLNNRDDLMNLIRGNKDEKGQNLQI